MEKKENYNIKEGCGTEDKCCQEKTMRINAKKGLE
jgi:hypothetical protein